MANKSRTSRLRTSRRRPPPSRRNKVKQRLPNDDNDAPQQHTIHAAAEDDSAILIVRTEPLVVPIQCDTDENGNDCTCYLRRGTFLPPSEHDKLMWNNETEHDDDSSSRIHTRWMNPSSTRSVRDSCPSDKTEPIHHDGGIVSSLGYGFFKSILHILPWCGSSWLGIMTAVLYSSIQSIWRSQQLWETNLTVSTVA
jgi:hypothetical protein